MSVPSPSATAFPSCLATSLASRLGKIPDHVRYGCVSGITGLLVEVEALSNVLAVGDRCRLIDRSGVATMAEVIGFRGGRSLVMPYGPVTGLGPGCRAEVGGDDDAVYPNTRWLGRVLGALGEPVDGRGPLPLGLERYPLRSVPPDAHARQRVEGKLDLGVRAINAFLTCCRGQRLGVFAGSGVGKSSLLSMLARHTEADVTVIGLIGERGREAREFIEDSLGEEGLKRSVVVVATSDQSPPFRRHAAYTTLAIAEYFRDHGARVLCLMDSVTRFAMAQREIGLAAGEPPTSKGYTPSVFAELPRLLERAGPGTAGQGSITGLFTVLVDGDDHNEPIADAVRGILDGHVVLDRAIAERGRFPAINVLKSVSRSLPGCNSDAENTLIRRARRLLSVYEDMAELIRLGAYRKGADPEVDLAVQLYPKLEAFIGQGRNERCSLFDSYAALEQVLAEAPEMAT
ncbi:MAG: flagellar protein export ATPase FliI [Rhodospirillales bacterium]|nr:flagellar protein export ATPase FliI [Rhodospirillales bacterium]